MPGVDELIIGQMNLMLLERPLMHIGLMLNTIELVDSDIEGHLVHQLLEILDVTNFPRVDLKVQDELYIDAVVWDGEHIPDEEEVVLLNDAVTTC